MKKIYLLLFSLVLFVSCGSSESQKAKNVLSEAAKIVNASTPMEIDEITVLTSCTFDGRSVIYTYMVDEELMTVVDMKENPTVVDAFRTNIKAQLNSPEAKAMRDNLEIIQGSVIHNYVGNMTGETMSIEVEV